MIPEKIPMHNPLTTYARVIFHPKNPSINTTRYSLISGEVIKNEKVIPKGIPASRKPRKIGIEEQEQKGVTAPKSAANRFPALRLWVIHALIFDWEIKVLQNPINAIIKNRSRMILSES
jgi:hypothetical protein